MITDSSERLKMKLANKVFRLRTRAQLINFLGGKCADCGFSDMRALQIDHINGGGSSERKKTQNSLSKVRALVFNRGNSHYQVLCANCNWIKRSDRQEYNPPLESIDEFGMELFDNGK